MTAAARKHLPPFRIEHVGSYLRPSEVKQTRDKMKQGLATAEDLRRVEDVHIGRLVESQQKVGIRSITDGEYRRLYFHIDFLEKLEGVGKFEISHLNTSAKPTPPQCKVVGKIRHVAPIQVDDFLFLKSKIDPATGAIPKVSIPSPTMLHFRGGRAAIDTTAYPDLEDFFTDLATAYRAEIAALYAAGCRYLQLDDTNLAYLCDETMRAAVTSRGEDVSALPRRYVELINACLRDVPHDMTVGVHLCRGNYKSTFFATGGYEPVAQVLFEELNVDVFFLEWDDSRSGGFEPLRFLPPHKTVVLGLISSKFPQLEDKATVIKRIHEAAAFVPKGIDQLALSPQCGFSSTADGNVISADDQWRKMQLIREIVAEVWGDDVGGRKPSKASSLVSGKNSIWQKYDLKVANAQEKI